MSGASTRSYRVGVVGGGVSGLAAAHRLRELARERGLNLSVNVLERHSRPGGLIRTERLDGMLLEGGPDQFVTHKPAGLELCERLGLGRELVAIDTRDAPPQVIHRGRPVALPEGCTMLGPTRLGPLMRSDLFSLRGKTRIACEPFIPRRAESRGDESLGSFVTRRFGREFLERVAEPILAGIFTADADRMSLEMTLPRYLSFEREHGSVTHGLKAASAERTARPARPAFVSLRVGLHGLIERLVSSLPADCLRLRSHVDRLRPDPVTGGWCLEIAGQPELLADAVILAGPAWAAAELLRRADGELATELAGLEFAPCATVQLVYPRSVIGQPLESFGFFVPRSEGLPILACSYVSNKFADRVPDDRVLLRAFLGGVRQPEVLDHDDASLARTAHDCLARLLRIEGQPLVQRVCRFPRSMPQFPVGFRSRLDGILQRARRHPGLQLCGSAVGAVGVPDCIASGEQAALRVIEQAAVFAAQPLLTASRA